MAPRNFSEDGAVGAGSGSLGGNFGTTNPTGGTTTTDSGMSPGGGINDTGIQLGAQGVMGIGMDGNLNPAGRTAGGSDSGGSFGGTTPAPSGGGLRSFPSSGGWGGGGLASPSVGAPATASGLDFGAWTGGGYNRVASFKDGGAIPDADEDIGNEPDNDGDDPNATDPQGSKLGQSLQHSINAAMQSVQNALSYGRNLHGLGGGQKEAAAMPTVPGNQSESGIPRERPMPGPLPPTSNPFGKRADAGAIDDGSDQEAQAMPSVPFSESQRPRPMPGPLPPTSNPFGKRGQQADAGSDAAPEQAIDTEEEAA